jgi:hypothetical protein
MLHNPDHLRIAQNVSSEASFRLDVGGWLFAPIEALAVTGKPGDATPLSQQFRGWKLGDFGGNEVPRRGDHIRRQRGRINSGAADHPFAK